MKDLLEISFPSVTWQLVDEHFVFLKGHHFTSDTCVCQIKAQPFHSLISFKLSLPMDNYRTSLWHLLCKRGDICYWSSVKRICHLLMVIYFTIIVFIRYVWVSVPLSLSLYIIFRVLHNPSVWRIYDLFLYYEVNKHFWIVEIRRFIWYLFLLAVHNVNLFCCYYLG